MVTMSAASTHKGWLIKRRRSLLVHLISIVHYWIVYEATSFIPTDFRIHSSDQHQAFAGESHNNAINLYLKWSIISLNFEDFNLRVLLKGTC